MTRNPTHWCLVALISVAVTSSADGQASPPAPPAPSTDVYTYVLGSTRSQVINITKRAGYDNQPAWIGGELYWTSQRDGQTDIYRLAKGVETAFTKTPESEYSAAVTPDARGVAVIRVERDSTQRLWRFPLGAGEPSLVLTDIKPVGYFAYLDANTLALFVLGNPATLQIADTRTGKGTVVANNPGRSVQHVPGGRKASFTQRAGGRTILETVDPAPASEGSAIEAVAILPDSADYVVWPDSNTIITGAGSRLLRLRLPSKVWTEIVDLSAQGIRHISRLALSPDGKTIAFVADEPRP